MDKFTKWLKSWGGIGTFVANVVVFLTTNWWLVLSAAIAYLTVVVDAVHTVVIQEQVRTACWVFLVLLWTYIGLVVLSDRRKPRISKPHLEYAYGLTFEGIIPFFNMEVADSEGAVAFAVNLRNFSPGPLKYEIEVLEVRIEDRALPKVLKGALTSTMSRGDLPLKISST